MCHGYTGLVGYSQLNDNAGFNDDHSYFFIQGTESILVMHTDIYTTKEMASTVPQTFRNERYQTYINSSSQFLGSQIQGVYGLLDEMNAYYHGGKSTYDTFEYYKKNADSDEWVEYLNEINNSIVGVLEFKYFIVKYMQYAIQKYPAVYQGIVNNNNFRKAFTQIDDVSAAWIAEYRNKKQSIYQTIETSCNVTLEEDGEFLYFWKGMSASGVGTFDSEITALEDELAKPQQTTIIQELRRGFN